MSTTVAESEWDARAELDLAAWIETYLVEQPPPDLSRVGRDLRELASLLRDDAQHRSVPGTQGTAQP